MGNGKNNRQAVKQPAQSGSTLCLMKLGKLAICVSAGLFSAVNLSYATEAAPVTTAVAAENTVEKIAVVGSRRAGSSLTDIPSPVSIVDAEQLTSQGTINMGELIRNVVPSFSVSEQPNTGTAATSRPANMRGLAPDHTLVLVNGKRYHRSADIPTFGSALIVGSQGPDISSIPAIALREVQVLRDGAAAQYGADAIAGVINFVLNNDPDKRVLEVRAGQYEKGDGETYSISGAYGLTLGKEGFITFNAEYSESNPTNRARSENLSAIQSLVDEGITSAVNENVVWGAAETKNSIKSFVNFAVEAGENAELYGFGSYAERETWGGFFYRGPNSKEGVFTTGGGYRLVGDLTPDDDQFCPGTVAGGGLVLAGSAEDKAVLAAVAANPGCFTWANVFPGGYSPSFGSQLEDSSIALGLRGETENGWNWDISAVYGSNELTFMVSNVTSPSFGGPGAPTHFDNLGSREQEELVFNGDIAKEFDWGLASPANVAAGVEWRQEKWTVHVGQLESFAQGPLFDQGFASGTDGYYGYGPSSAGIFSRQNIAAYLDIEADVTEALTLGAAVRYEDFSDLGSKITGKLSGLWHVTDSFGIRATVATGFHAPTPAQQNFIYAVTEADDDGNLVESGIIPANNLVAQEFGAVDPKPETSTSATLGFVYEGQRSTITVDFYRIEIEDRITLSNSFAIDSTQQQQLIDAGYVGVDQFSSIQFFTNDFDTETTGVDLMADFGLDLGVGVSKLSIAANWNETEVTKYNPDLTSAGRIYALEKGLPKTRGSATFTHSQDNWQGLVRANYFSNSTSVLFGSWLYETGSATTIDAELTYSFTDSVSFSVGGQNIFGKTPKDVSTSEIPNVGGGSFTLNDVLGVRYAPEAVWGFNGAYWYARLTYQF